ncbi:hypothetical protein Tdes44962_MAKER00988 [Teratosphaeria destructans]|uniref:Uncharacterized protein n=1 Tax=Teratosphaeria destructans TaxID=418781 RepID=A0A9W7SJK0_9PEZI|nr:hypothetical protein Tdes44962_MAKER00988 [Teratosphaeria destructans]
MRHLITQRGNAPWTGQNVQSKRNGQLCHAPAIRQMSVSTGASDSDFPKRLLHQHEAKMAP